MDFSIRLPVSFGVAHWIRVEGLRAEWGLKSTDDGVILSEENIKVRLLFELEHSGCVGDDLFDILNDIVKVLRAIYVYRSKPVANYWCCLLNRES